MLSLSRPKEGFPPPLYCTSNQVINCNTHLMPMLYRDSIPAAVFMVMALFAQCML